MTRNGWTRLVLVLGGLAIGALPSLVSAQGVEAGRVLLEEAFDAAPEGADWPKGWPRPQGATWEEEEGQRFLRLKCVEPGKLVMLYREVALPEGVETVRLTWRQRVTGLERGAQPWFDARIMMEFLDESRAKASPQPPTPKKGKDTEGWEDGRVEFSVPATARILKFMPSLLNVQAGTLDLDDIRLEVVTVRGAPQP